MGAPIEGEGGGSHGSGAAVQQFLHHRDVVPAFGVQPVPFEHGELMSVEAVGGFAPAEAAGDLVEGGGAPGEGLLHPYFRGGGEVEGAGDSVIVGGFGGK